jgi:predicted glycoside hydrolase/deacetylase ChbG (UPF0249 family)
MLMTTAYLEETVRDYVRPAALPTGIHLSLTLGKAVARPEQVPDLIDDHGNLVLSADRLLLSSFKGPIGERLLAQIKSEFDAQLALARDSGLNPTHADSHQHVHMNPAIFAVVEDLLPRFGIDRLRFCREPFRSFALGADLPALLKRNNPAKWALLRWKSAQVRRRLSTNDEFFGVLYSGVVSRRAILALIASAPAGRSVEIGIHPGFPAPKGERFYPRPGYNNFISSPERQLEHDVLVDGEVINLLRRRGLTLRSYDGRPKS